MVFKLNNSGSNLTESDIINMESFSVMVKVLKFFIKTNRQTGELLQHSLIEKQRLVYRFPCQAPHTLLRRQVSVDAAAVVVEAL